MKSLHLMPLVLLLSTCGKPSDSRVKDVATNVSGDKALSTSYIFYQEGDKVFRAACPVGTVVSDREHCKLRLESILAVPFFAKLAEAPELSVSEQEKKAEELYIEIAKTDARLLTMIPQTADAAKLEQFKADIDRLQADVAATAILLKELDGQISEAQAKLKTSNEVSLADQLLALQTKRTTLVSKRSDQHNLLNERRKQYVEVNQSLVTEPIFMGVQMQRQSYELKLKRQLEVLNTATLGVASLSQLRSMMSHSDFHFDIQAGEDSFPELRVIAKNMFTLFNEMLLGPVHVDNGLLVGLSHPDRLHLKIMNTATWNRRSGIKFFLVDDENAKGCEIHFGEYDPWNRPVPSSTQELWSDFTQCGEFGLSIPYNAVRTYHYNKDDLYLLFDGYLELRIDGSLEEKVRSNRFRIRMGAV